MAVVTFRFCIIENFYFFALSIRRLIFLSLICTVATCKGCCSKHQQSYLKTQQSINNEIKFAGYQTSPSFFPSSPSYSLIFCTEQILRKIISFYLLSVQEFYFIPMARPQGEITKFIFLLPPRMMAMMGGFLGKEEGNNRNEVKKQRNH